MDIKLDPNHKITDLSFTNIKPMGFVEPDIQEDEYQALGATKVPDEILNDGHWLGVVIEKEYQKKKGVETMGCTGFGTLNAVELVHKFRYDEEINLSDRCINILAGNNRGGNSPHKPAEALRNIGCCPEDSLPFDETCTSWQKFHSPNPLPQEILQECADFREKYDFMHDWIHVSKQNLKEYLKRGPIGISVLAWKMRNGLYFKNKGERDNHWCVLLDYEEGKFWYIFDTYDGFVKKLEWDYDFNYAKRYYFKKKVEDKPEETNLSNDMLKTVKFRTDPRVFIQDPVDTENLIWIQDKDGTSESDWNVMKKYHLIDPVPHELDDAHYPNYNIINWNISGDLTQDLNISIFSAILKKIVGLFKGK